jgi:hypothetical protein
MQELKLPKVDGHWLVYRESMETSLRKGAASKAITEYLEAIGYEQVQTNPTMIFQRGSSIASIYHPNPKRQKSEISIDFASSGETNLAELMMRINRFGNMPLAKDYEFWRAELDGLAAILKQGHAEARISDYAAERAMWYSVSVTLGVLSATLLGLLAILIFLVIVA